jgi:hypothetical protein
LLAPIKLSTKIAAIKLFQLLAKEFSSFFTKRIELIKEITEEFALLMTKYVP